MTPVNCKVENGRRAMKHGDPRAEEIGRFSVVGLTLFIRRRRRG